ncbi:MAG: MinD/ParA family protein [Haloglomus sp.]
MGEHVFAVTGGKGGVGKTTTVVNLGVALQQAGHNTVVVDADLAMADLGCRLELDCTPGIHEVLAGDEEIRDAIVRGPGDVTVLSGGRDLEGFAAADPERLPKTLELLSVAYDVVLVDTGPGIQRETMVAQRVADGVVLVTTPAALAVEDTAKTGELADRADAPVVGVVVTDAADERGVSEIADQLDTDLLAAVPHHPVQDGDPRIVTHPDSAAATAYRRLVTALPISDTDSTTDDPDEQVTGADDDETAEPTATDGDTAENTSQADADTPGMAATDDGVARHVDPAVGN